MAAHGSSDLERGEIDVAGVLRSYWLARAPRWPGQPAPPLLIALHGAGSTSPGTACSPVTGLFLVAGTALECSRRLSPAPQLRVSMTLVIGTADRTTPYEGGLLGRRGLSGALIGQNRYEGAGGGSRDR
jgi:hypothetical protein